MRPIVALFIVVLACAVPARPPPDSGSPDAGASDAGASVEEPFDGGFFADAGSVDAGSVDAGPVDAGSVDAGPVFTSSVSALPQDVRTDMTNKSWRTVCPVGLDALSLVTLSHWDFEGRVVTGELVVATRVADDVVEAFSALFDAGFPIERMRRVDAYGASDAESMRANNTSAFNCRRIANSTSWSKHSYGTAIDLNPIQNPWMSASTTDPVEGVPYRDRTNVRTGMIVRGGAVEAAFDAIGWGWGGDWSSYKDWQHFSEDGL